MNKNFFVLILSVGVCPNAFSMNEHPHHHPFGIPGQNFQATHQGRQMPMPTFTEEQARAAYLCMKQRDAIIRENFLNAEYHYKTTMLEMENAYLQLKTVKVCLDCLSNHSHITDTTRNNLSAYLEQWSESLFSNK